MTTVSITFATLERTTMPRFTDLFAVRVAAVLILLAVPTCIIAPAYAQITDAQACVNPALKDPILQGMKQATAEPGDNSGLGNLLRSGAQLKSLTQDTLVRRSKDEIVCRYDSVWTKAGVDVSTVKFIIKVTTAANGTADIDAYVE